MDQRQTEGRPGRGTQPSSLCPEGWVQKRLPARGRSVRPHPQALHQNYMSQLLQLNRLFIICFIPVQSVGSVSVQDSD